MKLFHCIVVMGAALGCGDSADTTESTSQHGGNDGGTPESGTTTDAGADSTRCNVPMLEVYSCGYRGACPGTATAPHGPNDCELPQQFDCHQGACTCNTSSPLVPTDCAATQDFHCDDWSAPCGCQCVANSPFPTDAGGAGCLVAVTRTILRWAANASSSFFRGATLKLSNSQRTTKHRAALDEHARAHRARVAEESRGRAFGRGRGGPRGLCAFAQWRDPRGDVARRPSSARRSSALAHLPCSRDALPGQRRPPPKARKIDEPISETPPPMCAGCSASSCTRASTKPWPTVCLKQGLQEARSRR